MLIDLSFRLVYRQIRRPLFAGPFLNFVCTGPSMLSQIHSDLRGVYVKALLNKAGDPVELRDVLCPDGPAQIPTWLLGGPADEAKKLAMQQQGPGRRAADPSSPPWRPDIPSRRPARGGRQQRTPRSQPEDAGAATGPTSKPVCRSSAGRTPTQPGASRMESPRRCLTRLWWREGAPALSRDPAGRPAGRAPLVPGPRRPGPAVQH